MSAAPHDPLPHSPRPEDDTVVVFRSWSDVEAEIVASLLRGSGVPCGLVSDVPHSVYPLTLDGLGEVRIVVAGADEEAARACIAAQPSPEDGTSSSFEDGDAE